MNCKFLITLLLVFFCIQPVFSQTGTVTKTFVIEKLTSQNTKEWYLCQNDTKKERETGERRYVFNKAEMKLSVDTCDHLLKWLPYKDYIWSIEAEGNDTPVGFHHLLLRVGKDFARFRFDKDFKTLYLKLPGSAQEVCLQ